MSEQIDIGTADIIAAVESELATAWYARSAQRRALGAVRTTSDDALGWGDLAIALAVWLAFPVALLLGMRVVSW